MSCCRTNIAGYCIVDVHVLVRNEGRRLKRCKNESFRKTRQVSERQVARPVRTRYRHRTQAEVRGLLGRERRRQGNWLRTTAYGSKMGASMNGNPLPPMLFPWCMRTAQMSCGKPNNKCAKSCATSGEERSKPLSAELNPKKM